METIRGKLSLYIDSKEFRDRLARSNRLILDLGTGDGRYVHALACRHPDWFVVGVDACRENLRQHSRAHLRNMLFLIASAQALPGELNGCFDHVTINFPWGSLLEGLLEGDPGLMHGLAAVSRPGAQIEIRLNGGALAEAGTRLEAGTKRVLENASRYGWRLRAPCPMDRRDLHDFPSTWARRLAHGRDPRAAALRGTRTAE